MSHKSPGQYLHKVNGYGDCWYCSEISVDPAVFTIDDPGSRGERMRVVVCRRKLCRESAYDGAFSRNDS